MTEIDILKLDVENRKLVFGKEIANTKFAEGFEKTLNEKISEINTKYQGTTNINMTEMNVKNEDLEHLKGIIEERKKMKDDITTCEWCGITYPKRGFTFYKIQIRNMNLEKLVEHIEKGIKDEDFDEHIICSDCYGHLEECKEC